MVKQVESIRLDPYHRNMVQMRASELGIKTSEYFRFLIEKDNNGRYRKPNADEYEQFQESRYSVKISDTQVALLKAVKREYENKDPDRKTAKDLKTFCAKYGFDKKSVKADLEKLVKLNIFNHGGRGETNYIWTKEGGFILPELAFLVPTKCPFVSGDIVSILKEMFGSYDETVQFVQDSLHVSKTKARRIFKIVLSEHIAFLNWLRDYAFDITGISDPNDVIYYRKQMMNFLMSFCLMVRDDDFVETDQGYRELCHEIICKLGNYFKKKI